MPHDDRALSSRELADRILKAAGFPASLRVFSVRLDMQPESPARLVVETVVTDSMANQLETVLREYKLVQLDVGQGAG